MAKCGIEVEPYCEAWVRESLWQFRFKHLLRPPPPARLPARRVQCVEYLGSLFRVQLDRPQYWSDYEVRAGQGWLVRGDCMFREGIEMP